VVFDPTGVLSEQVGVEQFLDCGSYRFRPSLDDRFSPPNRSVGGLDAQEEPPRRHFEQLVVDDFAHL